MRQKYLILTIMSGIITALMLYFFIRTIDDDKLIFVTMPLLMISGIITFLFAIWASKRESMKYLEKYGFELDETLISLLMKIDLSRRRQPVYLLAFYLNEHELRVGELLITGLKKNIDVITMPITSVSKILFETNLDTTACFLVVEGLYEKLSSNFKQMHSDYYLFDAAQPKRFKIALAVNSRNEFDTEETIKFLQNVANKFSIKIDDRRKSS